MAPSFVVGKASLPGNDANSRTSKMMNTPENVGFASRAASQVPQDDPLAAGVSILGFKSGSIAGKAGMQKGDVIVEYDGMRNLTTDKLMDLTTVTRPEGTHVRVVLMRDGHELSTQVPPGPLGISVVDTTMRTSSRRDVSDVFFSDLTERFKRWGLGTLGAYLVLGLLLFGATALGFLVIGSWDNLAILLMWMLVPAMLLGFLYYLIWSLLFFPISYYDIGLLFFGWVVGTLQLMRCLQDGSLIVGLMIFSCAAFFVLLWRSIHFTPSLRREQGTIYGMAIGIWTGAGLYYALWWPTWESSHFCWLATVCGAIGACLGRRMVDENK